MNKNKTNKSVIWPTTAFFTILPNEMGIADLQSLNDNFINITLRVRLTNAIKDGKIAEIGYIPCEKGRPLKVFTFTPVTKIVLEKAWALGIQPAEGVDKLLNVINVTGNVSHTNKINPAVVPSKVS